MAAPKASEVGRFALGVVSGDGLWKNRAMQSRNGPGGVSRWLALAWLVAVMVPGRAAGGETVSLAGAWRFQLDRDDVGIVQEWFERVLPEKIALPGSLPGQGIGDPVTVDTQWIGAIIDRSWFTAPEYEAYRRAGNVKVPFWLQPEKYYAGAAWYQREITVPGEWQAKRIILSLERPHWETRVWVDGRQVGANNALATPHEHVLGLLTPGPHRLTIRVDNRMVVDVGENAHSVSDHTQGNWNGIVGRIALRATAPAWIEELQVYPRVATRSVRVSGQVRGDPLPPTVRLAVTRRESAADERAEGREIGVERADGRFDTTIELGATAPLWDEFSPVLHRLTAILPNGEVRAVTFGLREITTAGTQFLINGRKTFIRGTLDCAHYPRTGHPPTDVVEWKRVIGVAKEHGLNLIRFHSWCPPEAAFVAADELGFYFHVEASTWPNRSTTLGDGQAIDRWLYEETERILRAYGNHPSFVLMASGNEPGGRQSAAYLGKWVAHYRDHDSRRLFSSSAGWPEIPENQWHCVPKPRVHALGDGLKARINARPPETHTDYRDYTGKRTVPVVSHEIGQWCVYPNFDEIPKYTGYLKPKNFEIFRDTLRAHGMGDQAKQFLMASGRLQTLCYKEEIESALRTPGMGGFELLDLHDFPGQGTALVGVLDAFWEEKGYVTPAEYRRFCGPTVLLARLERRVFTSDGMLQAAVEVAHFGRAPLDRAVVAWKLVGGAGQVAARGTLAPQTIPVGNGTVLGHVSVPWAGLPAPARYRLVVGLEGTTIENDWDVWVYPPEVDASVPPGVLVVDAMNARALAALDAGGRVLLLIPPERVRNVAKDKIMLGFSSIFWNTAWMRNRPPTTLGILCDPQHPALAAFPTEEHSNWQWWYLVSRAGAMILDDLPRGERPMVQVIDDWFTARKLGLIFEAKVRKGRLLVCSIDLESAMTENPVARQLRHSLLQYMASARFAPNAAVTEEMVTRLMTP
jgi:hypothetical protein